jgi:hypothetical protein
LVLERIAVLLRQDTNGLVTYHFESLAVEGVVHAVFTRLGGVSQGPFASLNVGHTVGDDEAAVAENHRRIYAFLQVGPDQVATAHQVHGNHVAVITSEHAGMVIPNTDGLVTGSPRVVLLLRFADCQPIVLYDPVHHAVGLIHAGWRGVAQGIARRAVEVMREAFATRSEDLIAGLGPAIEPCCYTVGDDVAAAMGYALRDWSRVLTLQGENEWRFDLPAANAQQLHAEGVRHIEQAHLCTACYQDEFYSHRGDNGQTGRFAVVAFLEPVAREVWPAQEERPSAGLPREAGDGESTTLNSPYPPGFPTFGEMLEGDS